MRLRSIKEGIEINDSRFSLGERGRIVVRSDGATIEVETDFEYFTEGGVFNKGSLKKEKRISLLRKVEFVDENGHWNPYPSVFQSLLQSLHPRTFTFSLGIFEGVLLYHRSPLKTIDRALFENAQKVGILVDLNGVDF